MVTILACSWVQVQVVRNAIRETPIFGVVGGSRGARGAPRTSNSDNVTESHSPSQRDARTYPSILMFIVAVVPHGVLDSNSTTYCYYCTRFNTLVRGRERDL